MRGARRVLGIVLAFMLLPGCWDQKLLSNSIIMLAYGIDLSESGQLSSSLYLVSGENKIEVVTVNGLTPRDTKMNANQRLAGNVEASKNRLILISDAAAKKGVYPYLDVFYRDPISALNAKIGIVEGSTERLLKLYSTKSTRLLIEKLFVSSEEVSSSPVIDVQDLNRLISDDGTDAVIPYLAVNDKDEVVVTGSAMFHREFLHGKLTLRESEMLILMRNKLKNAMRIETHTSDISGIRGFLSSNVVGADSKVRVSMKGGQVLASVDMDLRVQLVEYPERFYMEKSADLHELEVAYEKELEKQAVQVFKHLQQANCDALGLSRRLQSFHPRLWKSLDWEKDYAKVQFQPHIRVKIIGTGILN
ncbi:Ger(x)C family spore germination protein [Paenibacillus koleovorans]|uniref:Ger(x)C family spore germination protein n=1 Tax=Paenibacillus koleovorans TaxID=121608 RepID=UPI000FD7FC9A|nr:Ger(x)C family spore germination protein [Paenibacillus koleovorans]